MRPEKVDRPRHPAAWPDRPATIACILALAMVLAARSAAMGFATDDHLFRVTVEHGHRVLDLFRFASGDLDENRRAIALGRLPWWTAPDFKLHFVRPLTGALFALDMAAFGDRPLGYHAHSLLWFLGLLVAAALLFRRTLPHGTAAIATAIFAFRSAHVLPYAWLSARHVLVGAVPATCALLVHLGARHRASRAALLSRFLLAPLLLIVGLLGSEAALAVVPFFVAFEAYEPIATRLRPEARARSRITGVAPVLAVAVVYLVIYRAVGGGARSSGGYHDPLADPVSFARVAAVRVPMLLADALLGTPVSAASAAHPAFFVAAGLAAVALCVALWRTATGIEDSERDTVAWIVPAAGVALLFGATGLPGGRVLVIPDLGAAVLLAVLLRHGFARTVGSARTWTRRTFAAVLVFQHAVAAPLASLAAMRALESTANAADRVAHEAQIDPASRPRAFILASSDPFVFLYPAAVLADTEPGRVRCFTSLSGARKDHRVTRTGPRSLTLEPLGGPMLESFDTLFRDTDHDAHPFQLGDPIHDCGAVVRVQAVTDGKPARIEVTFLGIDDLDGGGGTDPVALLVWDGQRLARFIPPQEGESVIVPYMPGPGRRVGL